MVVTTRSHVFTTTSETCQRCCISDQADKPPIHIVGCRLEIDKRPPSGTPRLSPHALVQEYLNKTEHLWAIATNGFRWRLLRDSSLMTRLTYIEFDLEQILKGENFAEWCMNFFISMKVIFVIPAKTAAQKLNLIPTEILPNSIVSSEWKLRSLVVENASPATKKNGSSRATTSLPIFATTPKNRSQRSFKLPMVHRY
ncbi:hypothetical protein [Fischerella major]|uniref:hypothetical protein n=1 Tax=Fischerella major TaxID=210993 RepID=UPI0021142B28|nr:hypothetical protein [Fischerella major]